MSGATLGLEGERMPLIAHSMQDRRTPFHRDPIIFNPPKEILAEIFRFSGGPQASNMLISKRMNEFITEMVFHDINQMVGKDDREPPEKRLYSAQKIALLQLEFLPKKERTLSRFYILAYQNPPLENCSLHLCDAERTIPLENYTILKEMSNRRGAIVTLFKKYRTDLSEKIIITGEREAESPISLKRFQDLETFMREHNTRQEVRELNLEIREAEGALAEELRGEAEVINAIGCFCIAVAKITKCVLCDFPKWAWVAASKSCTRERVQDDQGEELV